MKVSRQSHGFTLIELMISLGLMSIIAIGAGYAGLQLQKTQNTTAGEFWLDVRRQEIFSYLKDDTKWAEFLQTNPQMSCLRDNVASNCQGISGGPFSIEFSSGGNVEVLQPVQGFTMQGLLCDDFPSARCRYQAQTSWQPLCRTVECANPEARLTINFYKTTDGSAIHLMESKVIEVVRREKVDSRADICISITGNAACNFNALLGNCPGGSYLVGFDSTGGVICQNIDYTCPSGIMAGFGADGSAMCGSGCP